MGGIWLNWRATEYASFKQHGQPSQTSLLQDLLQGQPRPPLTMISMELHLEVPQYMAIPWLITWVMALTVSSKTERQFKPGEATPTKSDPASDHVAAAFEHTLPSIGVLGSGRFAKTTSTYSS